MPVRIMTLLGTRPEIIRLSRLLDILDARAEHTLVHTGQNFDPRLSDIFFDELSVRRPDEYLGVRAASAGAQIGKILEGAEAAFKRYRPERLLILGDTNSGLSALIARRLGIPVYHMEAGNRCFDDRVPEEVNRRVIDHSSTVLLPYTERSRENLLREGIPSQRIYVTGNPIWEVMKAMEDRVDGSRVLAEVGVAGGGYFLVTLHRAENVDDGARLRRYLEALQALSRAYGYPVVCSTHPRTQKRLEELGETRRSEGQVLFLPPFGFADFLRLEREAFCILSDSGTVQEEAAILKVPTVTLRDVTERPETIECGSNVLGGSSPEKIAELVEQVVERRGSWTPPREYLMDNVSATVANILLGYRIPEPAEAKWLASQGSGE